MSGTYSPEVSGCHWCVPSKYLLDVFLLQLELITAQAMRAGFTGGMVVDYPNSAKAKK